MPRARDRRKKKKANANKAAAPVLNGVVSYKESGNRAFLNKNYMKAAEACRLCAEGGGGFLVENPRPWEGYESIWLLKEITSLIDDCVLFNREYLFLCVAGKAVLLTSGFTL